MVSEMVAKAPELDNNWPICISNITVEVHRHEFFKEEKRKSVMRERE